ncbi:PREDICTED: 2-hydroxyisoflavanone dehydratase-like [Ipomoea nil]|uniref:2-hydroxyisoflavanone dehydratase-like n=1 Tax=Ipomoea nil TaxID=35883 RepID=UPI0009016382|nr:PREDICTED: 2-hydroxyisoflavanone dehydratase-like [Ipomoea nil]
MSSSLVSFAILLSFAALSFRLSTAAGADDDSQVVASVPPLIWVYKNGTIKRPLDQRKLPPSPHDPATGVSSRDITISGNIPARIYLPNTTTTSQKLSVLIWYHGGGFCMGSAFASGDHQFLNILSSKAGLVAISVDYRLAPEHLLPAAFEDSWAALNWVASHAPGSTRPVSPDPWLIQYGDFSRIFLGGDSAGATIVHNMIVRTAGEPLSGNLKIFGGILTHPYFWASKDGDKESFGYKLWTFVYPSAPGGIDNPMVNPFAKNAPALSGLQASRIFVSVAEHDGLNVKGIEYVKALNASGWKGEVTQVFMLGVEHSFYLNHIHTKKAYYLIEHIAKFIGH